MEAFFTCAQLHPCCFSARSSLSSSSARHRIFCGSARRHHRRRDSDSSSSKTRRENAFEIDNPDPDKVVISLDLHTIKDRASVAAETATRQLRGAAVRAVRFGAAIQNDSREFWRDLRSSVSVQKDKRIVISIRRSSIEFAASALFWSLLLVAVWKIFAKAAKKYRWGWDASFDSEMIVRRDRSLGGKEVLVGKNYGNIFANSQSRSSTRNASRNTRLVNPLDAVEISRSEKEMAKQRGAQIRSVGNSAVRLPSWWPAPEVLRATDNLEKDDAQKEASFVARVIMDKRLSGRDFQETDILQLRRICKHSGAAVRFDTVNVRDALYRAAIDLVLSSCGRIGTMSADVGGEKATDFLAGLADNIGLEAERAATMVNAAIAARTRSTFLQAWALYVRGKLSEAEEDIARISRIHAVLPSDKNSPEMEMVAQGLGRHLSLDERKHLLQMYLKVGSSGTQRIASEALGIYSTKERVWPTQ